MKLNVQAKRQHFMALQSKTIDNDKKFLKTVKPLFLYIYIYSNKKLQYILQATLHYLQKYSTI